MVGAVNITVGQQIGAGATALVLSNSAAVLIDLTISESDLAGLRPGQLGIAEVDALDGRQYVVRILSVSTVPNVAQGVVTFPAQAEILQGDDLLAAGSEIAPLLADLGGLPAGGAGFLGDGAPAGGFADGGLPGGGGGGFGGGRGGAGGFQLPEGLDPATLREALQRGELPEGVQLPEGVDLDTLRARVGQAPPGGGGPAGDGERPGGGALQALLDQPLPVEGMSASVTILLEVRASALLVPANAVLAEGGTTYVVVPSDDGENVRRTVVIGETSDGQTEILAGLEEGETVLIGGSASALVATATTPTPTPTGAVPGGGFGPPGGGFGGSGGGGGGGGGGAGGIR